jgi:hypothetical protein
MGSGCGRSYTSADGWQVGVLDFPLVESISHRVADSWVVPGQPESSKVDLVLMLSLMLMGVYV